MVGLKNEEILTCLLLVVVGYFIAMMFSRSCNGFSVNAQRDGWSDGVAPHGRFPHIDDPREDDPLPINALPDFLHLPP